MNIIEAISRRKSIRGFKPTPVPKGILKKILDTAIRSPSALNAQPWEITVVTGEVLENIKRGNLEMLASGAAPNLDVPGDPLEGIHRQRQVNLAIQLFQLMGIKREDRQQRAEWQQRGFRFFDAPTAFIIYTGRALNTAHTQFDIGIITQTICLASLSHGLGTCIADQGIMYPEVVRKFTGIPDSKRISICIAIGYPDWDFPANKIESEREPVDSITTWCGFE